MTFKRFYFVFFPAVFLAAFATARYPAPVADLARLSPFWCPLRKITGWLCPSCGLTHACLYLLRGDFQAALLHHPLSPAVFVIAICAWGMCVANYDLMKTVAYFKKPAPSLFLKCSLAMVVLWGIARNF